MTRTKDWLKHSEELLEISNLLIDKQKYFWSCVTSHESATAALKAILSYFEESTFGDNLIALLRIIQNNCSVPEEVKIACQKVNPYFKSCRDLEMKPTGTPLDNFSDKDAKIAKDSTLVIIRFAYSQIK